MSKLDLSDEEKKRRSDQAKALHAQGKFGGPQPGSGRPRKKRASEVIAERVHEEGTDIFERLMTIVRDGTDPNSISASRTLLEIEDKETNRQEREEDRVDDMNRQQLLLFVMSHFEELIASGAIPGLGDVIEGTIVEVEDDRPSRNSEISAISGED